MLRSFLGAAASFLLLSFPAAAGSLTFNIDQSTLDSPLGGPDQPGVCQNQDGNPFNCLIFSGSITTGGDMSQDYLLLGVYISMSNSNPDMGADVNDFTEPPPYDESAGNLYFLNATALYGDLGPSSAIFDTPDMGLFEIDVSDDAPYGTYNGTATLDYIDGKDCTDPTNPCTVSENFTVVVNPEPGPFLLAASGLAGLGFLRRRFALKTK